MNFESIKTVYFIGIGGIGMSALARYFAKHGKIVHGYDRTETALTRALTTEGMAVHYTDDPSQIPQGVDLVVWTPAVPADHRELNWFRERQIPLKKRAEVLGIISKSKRCIAIAGTHGKTTTSTLTSWLLRQCGIDVTAFVGGISGNMGANFIEGESDWVVVEADEYDRSFLHLYPEIAVINSVDADHLDIYGSPDEVLAGYRQFARQVKTGGILLTEARTGDMGGQSFGIETGDFQATNIRVENGYTVFDLHTPEYGAFEALKMPYPGLHNIRNAVAAIAVTLAAGGDPSKIHSALAGFKGVKRRFETIVRTDQTVYIDDYAHHPAEIEACIQAARSLYPDQRIVGVFQPHLYSRTRDFAPEFAAALDGLDQCVLLPVYPARELPIEGVDSDMILGLMKLQDKSIVQKSDLLNMIKKAAPQVLITMGAGDIDLLVEPLKNHIEQA